MKRQVQKMQKVSNALKTITNIVLIFFLILMWFSCNSLKNIDDAREYAIKRLDGTSGSYLNIKLFDFENKQDSIPGFVKINGVYFDSDFKSFHHTINVAPGSYSIESFYISKEVNKIKDIKVGKNDSLLVSVYMKDSTEPIE